MNLSLSKTILAMGLVLAGTPAFAVTNLIVVGRDPSAPTVSFGNQPPAWAPYLIPTIFLVAGVVQFLYPRIAWTLKMLGKRWEFGSDVEPSALWLFFARLGGLVWIAISALMFVAIFKGTYHFHH